MTTKPMRWSTSACQGLTLRFAEAMPVGAGGQRARITMPLAEIEQQLQIASASTAPRRCRAAARRVISRSTTATCGSVSSPAVSAFLRHLQPRPAERQRRSLPVSRSGKQGGPGRYCVLARAMPNFRQRSWRDREKPQRHRFSRHPDRYPATHVGTGWLNCKTGGTTSIGHAPAPAPCSVVVAYRGAGLGNHVQRGSIEDGHPAAGDLDHAIVSRP